MKNTLLVTAMLIPSALAAPSSGNAASAATSGNLGVFAIVDRVQFEPNEQAPERIRVHGAFAFVNYQDFRFGGLGRGGTVAQPLGVTNAAQGFLYFKLPAASAPQVNITAIKREWADLKSVAGTGQAVGFGEWFYLGQFGTFRSDGRGSTAPSTVINSPNEFGDMRVYGANETAPVPALYQTNVGVTRLTEASHAAVIRQLRAALGAL